MLTRRTLALASASAMLAIASAVAVDAEPAAQPTSPLQPRINWPTIKPALAPNPALEARIDAILARMSIEEKVAQIIQPDIASITPADVRTYKFGSILAGGNSSPGGVETAPPVEWLKLADAYWEAAQGASWAGQAIPLMWGIDAVHGHANIVGATIFPQNIGLGATRDPDLIRRIGEVTAREMTVTGFDWDFSPTLAVVRDDRWGRTYEGFSEDPEIVRSYAGKMVEGLQGAPGSANFLGAGKVIATAKHFVGDGGTAGGKDQGDNRDAPQNLKDIHGAGYPAAIGAGVQSVMASFSSVRGVKVHGDRSLLTGALKQDMGFDGLVVGDWNAHGQVPGCTNTSCAAAVNAGLDVFMAPDSWKDLYTNTLSQARSGQIAPSRLDDAVRRVLRVKMRAGLFEKGKPSSRPYAGQFENLGGADHRAVARDAVRKSLVLLKNSRQLLPLSPKLNVLVAGDGADNIAKQSGGWTISWQGSGIANSEFRNAQSIYSGIEETVKAAGGSATLSPSGQFGRKPDVAIVVFGEEPYAEFVGDRPNSLEFSPADQKDLDLLKQLKATGIPVVSVFLSGRPLWVNPHINNSDSFVAAFLPGGEGGGIADVLFKTGNGAARYDFRGKLSYSWPRRPDQTMLNRGDRNYDPLFPYGFGLTYSDRQELPRLSEAKPVNAGPAEGLLFSRGRLAQGWTFGFSPVSTGKMNRIDRRAQEDARAFTWPGVGTATVALRTPTLLNLSRETTGQLSLEVQLRVDVAPTAPVSLGMSCGPSCSATVPIGRLLRSATVGEWRTITVPLGCFARAGLDPGKIVEPLSITTAGRLGLAISDVRINSATISQSSCGDLR